jgi:hypothetical protein
MCPLKPEVTKNLAMGICDDQKLGDGNLWQSKIWSLNSCGNQKPSNGNLWLLNSYDDQKLGDQNLWRSKF